MIIQGDCLEELKKLEDNSVDLVVTDPPYGYSFMGKDWDKAVPSVEVWQECLRVLKPGAFAFVMSAPRSDVQWAMIDRIKNAGFRVDFTPIYWTYASGFPKAMNMAKAVDKRNGVEFDTKPASGVGFMNAEGEGGYNVTMNQMVRVGEMSDEAKALDGSYGGFQPKPAVEVVIVAMKPLSEKTYVDQALKNGKGITWLDDVRIPTAEKVGTHCNNRDENGKCRGHDNAGQTTSGETVHADESDGTQGRFPANLIVSDQALNGHSKYFDLDAWADTLPFLAVPKASKREKNEGLEGYKQLNEIEGITKTPAGTDNPNLKGRKANPIDSITQNRKLQSTGNFHPTVKPLKLMSYLITLGSRENDVILDPFLGSGTTCLAAKQLNRKYIGIEREPEYCKIAEARIAAICPTGSTP